MAHLLVQLLIPFILLTAPPVLAISVEGKGVIRGRITVRNETGQTLAYAKQPVTLEVVQLTQDETKKLAASRVNTNVSGEYRFDNFNQDSQFAFQIIVEYHQAKFKSAQRNFPANETTLKLDLELTPVKNDLGLLKVELLHTAIFADADSPDAQVEQTWIIKNDSPSAFFDAEGLRLNIPQGAFAPQINANDDFRLEESSLVWGGLIPATTKVEFTAQFLISHPLGRLRFYQELPIQLERLGVLLLPINMLATGEVKSYGIQNINGQNYQVYLGDYRDGKPRHLVEFKLSGIPGGFGIIELIMLIALGTIAVCTLWLVRRHD